MDSSSGTSSGFPPHVWNQLHQASLQSANQGRGNRNRNHGRRGQGRGGWSHQSQQPFSHDQSNPVNSWQQDPSVLSSESFPPLGTTNIQPDPRSLSSHPPPQHNQVQPEIQTQPCSNRRHGTPREYQERARGNYRGVSRPYDSTQHAPLPAQPINSTQFHSSGRPPPRHGRLYNPNASMHYGTVEQQRSMRHVIMKQSDYLNGIGKKAVDAHRISEEEATTKENFRRKLENVVKRTLCQKYPGIEVEKVKLKCYGSLANGFALAGCDLDLLLCLPDYPQSESQASAASNLLGDDTGLKSSNEGDHGFKVEVRRVLEKAFLDEEYGARLLTNTRVPILRICENPTPELLQNLRENHAAWETSLLEKPVTASALQTSDEQSAIQASDDCPPDIGTVDQALAGLKIANEVARKPAPRGNSGLEFTGDCGIQCDVNFQNFVALHNSALLRTYSNFDPRVREVGRFVKVWAKARDINTPYRGTLSSYGYILMVLHYLMNVASPPVIPNLQYFAKIDDDWNPGKKVELFEGFDVRFVQDKEGLDELRADMAANPALNRESPGHLLRGFFQYYASRQGFHWQRDVISIRTKGGILTKQEKGWTAARVESNNVRLRYLFAIEDPFEVEHNIARTVGHHGIVTIRDEFRRAWSIIEKNGAESELSTDEFLQPVLDHIDTLKKDQESRTQKRQMQMRKELEAREKTLLQEGDDGDADAHTDGTLGNPERETIRARSSRQNYRRPAGSKLTSTPSFQDKNQSLPLEPWRTRKVLNDSEDDDIEVADCQASGKDIGHQAESIETKPDQPADTRESNAELQKRTGGLCSREEVLLANGLDHLGNPVPWDIGTQEGRWLHWRDMKLKRGQVLNFCSPTLRELHEQCPFDPRRPNPYSGKPYRARSQRIEYERPPWPAENPSIRVSAMLPSQQSQRPTTRVARSSNGESHGHQTTPRKDLPDQSDIRDGTVGELIPWDQDTRGGSWLRFRDTWIRQAKWEHHRRSKYTELSNEFPYNPNMTWTELEEKNKLLRKYYKQDVFRRRIPGVDIADEISAGSVGSLSRTQSSLRRVAASTVSDGQDQPKCQALLEKVEELPKDNPSLPWAKSGQSGQPADTMVSLDSASNGTHSEVLPRTPPEIPPVPDLDFLRSQRLIFFEKWKLPQNEPEGHLQIHSHKGVEDAVSLANEGFQTLVQSSDLVAQEAPAIEDSLGNQVASDHAEGKLAVLQPFDIVPDKETVEASRSPFIEDLSLKVPATLYPDADESRRPRDEDPKIIPIPRALGFQFDPRQLQDLAVIAKGGNGCARDGAEFKLEEDEYEWGGGGMMGWRTSTGPQHAGVSGGRTPYEAGRGDEEGLLNELPGEID